MGLRKKSITGLRKQKSFRIAQTYAFFVVRKWLQRVGKRRNKWLGSRQESGAIDAQRTGKTKKSVLALPSPKSEPLTLHRRREIRQI